MPFLSRAQRRKCYWLYNKAIKEGKTPSWDCREWEFETVNKNLPEYKTDTKKKITSNTNSNTNSKKTNSRRNSKKTNSKINSKRTNSKKPNSKAKKSKTKSKKSKTKSKKSKLNFIMN